MGKLFGTDGVRGKANVELTPELAFNLGRAGAYVLTKERAHAPRILLGMDTRISGDMLGAALTAGMCSVGARVISAGIIPTPAIAYLVRKYGLDAGVMISASHNPYADNGIKFFDGNGYKLKDELENEIEGYILNGMADIPRVTDGQIGLCEDADTAISDYVAFLQGTVGNMPLAGMKIALDCANGATFEAAPLLFRSLGADVRVIHNTPDGLNINDHCGSTHVESLLAFVKETGADIGFAFDGDGDRLITVDEHGDIVDGDQFMSIVGNHLKQEGKLKNNVIVATVMSNLGFFQMGEKYGITIESTKVGDRYVLERMLKKGHILGGEQSGHIIFLEHNTTGDGILSALQLSAIVKQTGKPLSTLNQYMEVLPQVLINAKVSNDKKHDYLENEEVEAAIKALEKKFEGRGRVLIRPSGTEPTVRVMIEGRDIVEITKEAKALAALLEQQLV